MQITCGIFIFDVTGNILICCPRGTKDKYNWTIPKGKAEKDEKYIDAAIRETKEEAGLDVSSLKRRIKEVGEKKYKNKKKKLIAFALEFPNEIKSSALECIIDENGKHEIIDYEMVAPKEAMKRLHNIQSELLEKFLSEKK